MANETVSASASSSLLNVVGQGPSPIVHLKPRVDESTLTHRHLKDGPFWQQIPAWKDIDEATFLSHLWQEKNAITTPEKLVAAVRDGPPGRRVLLSGDMQ